jgi:hypothetical protein
MISRWYTVTFDPACMQLCSVYVGRAADVSKVGPAFIKKVQVK